MTNSDDELIQKIASTVIQKLGFMWQQLNGQQRDAFCNDIRTIIAAVREHDIPKPSPAPKRVAVQINTFFDEGHAYALVLANDGTVFWGGVLNNLSRWNGDFSWREQLPPLPQQDGAP